MSRARRSFERLTKLLREETTGLHPRLHALEFAASLLPRTEAAGLLRARLMARFGFAVAAGASCVDVPKLSGSGDLTTRLSIGEGCFVDVDCILDLEERITLEEKVTLGPGVMILTSSHELASAAHRAGPITRAPVVVRRGAWLRARAIVLPGVTIGEGAIVEPGAVVNKDVAPHTRVGGIPAARLEALGGSDG